MRGVMVGRLRMVVARKSESRKPRSASVTPRAISKMSPVMKMLLMLWSFFSALFWAVYRIMAKVTPQSRKRIITVGAVRAMAYKP